jgi:putative nucleotidyltransferase with HDIG domain
MDLIRVWLIDEGRGAKEKLAQFLSGLGFHVVPLNSLSELSPQPAAADDPALAIMRLTALTRETAAQLTRVRGARPNLSFILLADLKSARRSMMALQKGLVDQVASAENPATLASALKSEVAKRQLAEKSRDCARQVRHLKSEQNRNQRRAAELEETYNATLENLMTALDLRDVETFGHSLTVAKYCRVLAHLIGIKDAETLDNIRRGALLHDIGKIAIPDAILKKPSRLTAAEWEKIRLHPVLGYGLVKEIKLVKEVGNIILYHHERYDGTGYPKGLKRDSIPVEARIFALADALDAITSHRPYRKERDFKAARRDIQENRGSQFDPRVVDAFCSVRLEDWERIRYETTKMLPAMETFSQVFSRA